MSNQDYLQFIQTKGRKYHASGRRIDPTLVNPKLFPFQRDIVVWAVGKGRCAVFADTGLGKTFIQLEWARLLGGTTLIVAPLSVSRQTIREAKKIGLSVNPVKSTEDITVGINITNYENLDNIARDDFDNIVLDESSILKAIDGKTRRKLVQRFSSVPNRMCCTATPAPNDQTEIGNHAEFLGVCSRGEMLSTFFINANHVTEKIVDSGVIVRVKQSNKHGTEWRLRYHAQDTYYRWLSSWAIAVRKPSDLGYDDDGYVLPGLEISPEHFHIEAETGDELFFTGLRGIAHRAQVRRGAVDVRSQRIKTICDNRDQWIVWCGLDVESKTVSAIIDGAVEVEGADSSEKKAKAFEDFQDGKIRVLVTKPKIAGFGMNFQNCHNMVFFGLSDSWEAFYQCIRRCYRFGQKKPVNVRVLISDIEHPIYENVIRKGEVSERMMNGLIKQVKEYEMEELGKKPASIHSEYSEERVDGRKFIAYRGDSCQVLQRLGPESIDLSVYSPPFADLYTYSPSERDLGNSVDWPEFFKHYAYIVTGLLRVTRPGRICCVHTSDIPAMAMKDGYIGIRDFPGAIIEAHTRGGWTYYGRAIVTKNPQAQAIRTKSKALLFTQLRKDSSDSRPALLDHILIFKKPGDTEVPVTPVKNGEIDNEKWIDWAGGIWTGISESDTLQYTTARDKNDEKHICPLQLGTIERCIKLYTNPGEVVLSPFMGIGSEIYQAIKFGRRGIGIELKKSYFDVAVRNLREAEDVFTQSTLFDVAAG